jgi:hypothetical protein
MLPFPRKCAKCGHEGCRVIAKAEKDKPLGLNARIYLGKGVSNASQQESSWMCPQGPQKGPF